jgi:hypothetical protein
MKKSLLLIVGAIGLASVASVKAGDLPDLSAYGTPVETTGPVHPAAPSNEPTNRHWPAHVCAEIQRVEKDVVSGMGPADRAMPRLGLLMLEGLHCGIDVSRKMAADEAALKAAAQRAASTPQGPIIVEVPQDPTIIEVPQAALEPAAPVPPRPLNCFTTRLGGGMSTTTCR